MMKRGDDNIMDFSDETIRQAWKRANRRCECERAKHRHPSTKCGKSLLRASRGGSEAGAWEAHRKSSGSNQKSDSPSSCIILCRDCGCWMCDPKQYKNLVPWDQKIERLVDQDKRTYVIVPRESHVKHHLLVVLKAQRGKHKRGLIECTKDDLRYLGKTIYKWCSILKKLPSKYDTVYAGCYSDEGHVHFHLIPFNHKRNKGYYGFAMTWLAEKECKSAANPFCKMSHEKKNKRVVEFAKIVKELQGAKNDYGLISTGEIALPPN